MAHKKFIENPLGVWLSKKQSLLIPLQELKRRIPACSLGDLYGSVSQGYPRKSSPPLGDHAPAPGGLRWSPAPRGRGAAMPRLQGGKQRELLGSRGGRNFPPAKLAHLCSYLFSYLPFASRADALLRRAEELLWVGLGCEQGCSGAKLHGSFPAQLPAVPLTLSASSAC